MEFIPVMQNNFQHHHSSLQICRFAAKKYFLLFSMLKAAELLNIFVENAMFIFQDSFIKEQHLFEKKVAL